MYLKSQRIIRHMKNIFLLFILFGGFFFLFWKSFAISEHSVMVPLLCQRNLLSRLPCARHYATSFINIKSVPHRVLPSRNYFYVRDEKLGFKNHDVQSQRITWYFCHTKFLIETFYKLIFCKCRDSCGLFGSDYWKLAIKNGDVFIHFFLGHLSRINHFDHSHYSFCIIKYKVLYFFNALRHSHRTLVSEKAY